MTTPLAERLRRHIAHNGPISVSEYMAACLFDPQYGYYITQEPFGRNGDFVTAPEISQMFGELVAVWVVAAWRTAGGPENAALVEIGPGRGTLMSDMLRAIRKTAGGFLEQCSICMIETSPRLETIQKETLGADAGTVKWLKRFEDVPKTAVFVVGNEVFDAIPVRQYIKVNDRWIQRMVGIDRDGALTFVLGAGEIAESALPPTAGEQPDGTVSEIAPVREALAETVAENIAGRGGAALFLDYGHPASGFGDTLQAVRRHRHVDVLANSGRADLTSHVDFGALARAAGRTGAKTAGMTQGEFLIRMGLVERAGRLGAAHDKKGRERIRADIERLAGRDGMGELFKAMTIFPSGARPWPF